jgi:hypothetical protein
MCSASAVVRAETQAAAVHGAPAAQTAVASRTPRSRRGGRII